MRNIDYLVWARRHMGRVRYDLAKSNVRAVSPQELGLRLEDVRLNDTDEEGNPELVSLLAKRYGTTEDRVLVTHGATQALHLAAHALIGRGDEVLLESPNYEPLYRVLLQAGARVRILERRFERGFQIDLEDVERAIGRGTRAVVLTNLHNPSGVATSPERLRTLCQIADGFGASVVCSEVYLDNAFQPGHRPVAAYGPRAISIGSLSKIYGLGGLRVGWMVADPALLERAKAIADYVTGGLSAPSGSFACAALRKSEELVRRCTSIVRGGLEEVRAWVAGRRDLRWIEPDGGTVCMIRLPAGVDARHLSELLREKYSTLVVPGEFFWLRGFVRISCGVERETLRSGLANVGTALDELQSGR